GTRAPWLIQPWHTPPGAATTLSRATMLKQFGDFLLHTLKVLAVDLWPMNLVVVLGLVAVYVLLPRPRRIIAPLGGAALAAAALVLAGGILIWGRAAPVEAVLFYAFAGIAIVSGGLLVTQRNPVHAALSFALVVLSTCGLFLLQAAPFLMAATVIV